jgi:hypothetical protein
MNSHQAGAAEKELLMQSSSEIEERARPGYQTTQKELYFSCLLDCFLNEKESRGPARPSFQRLAFILSLFNIIFSLPFAHHYSA